MRKKRGKIKEMRQNRDRDGESGTGVAREIEKYLCVVEGERNA